MWLSNINTSIINSSIINTINEIDLDKYNIFFEEDGENLRCYFNQRKKN